jgi:hypothetical protein
MSCPLKWPVDYDRTEIPGSSIDRPILPITGKRQSGSEFAGNGIACR